MRSILALILLLIFSHSVEAAPLKVVASFSILGDITKQIGSDDVDVTTLVAPDTDTHTYQPTPDDVKKMAKADMVIMNGLGFEGWLPRVIQSSGFRGNVVTASDGIKAATMEDDGKVITDPHAWQDPNNGHMYVFNIATALEKAIPEKAKDIAERAKKYDEKITKIDADIRQKLEAIPDDKKRIITSHDAFGYFGRAYHIQFLAPVGMSTEAEPSASDIAQLINQMKKENIKIVFFENMASPRLIEQLGKDAGAKVGGTLYADALSAPGKGAGTYLDMFRNNVPKLIDAMKK